MMPTRVLLLACLSPLAASMLVLAAFYVPLALRPVYTVAQVQDGLAHHLGDWLGRTVQVRGVAVLCLSLDAQQASPFCGQGTTWLLDAGENNRGIPLVWGTQDGMLAFLRRLPFVSRLVGPPQSLRWGLLATYQVQPHAAGSARRSTRPCYEALLMDAVP
jgi:hypothetical protein